MRFSSFIILLALISSLAGSASAQSSARGGGDSDLERRINAEPNVAVSLCLASGDVVVRGWDQKEVVARAADAGSLELQGGVGRVEVVTSRRKGAELAHGDCGSISGLELSVPRGATVSLQVRSGNIELSDVAEARVQSLSGDVSLRRVSRAVEVSSLSGDVSLTDSGGRVRLRAVSGSVEASNVRTVQPGDEFDANSTSGDVTLRGISHPRVKGVTVSGSVYYTGALARGGAYEFKTISGDVTLELPADASFSLRANVVVSGEIVTDFPVRTDSGVAAGVITPTPPEPPPTGRHGKPPAKHHGPNRAQLNGTVGDGGADVNLSSFSGTLYIKRK